jgi:transposase
MYHLFMHRREEYMDHYHKRSNIETAYSMIKGKFGSSLRSRSDTGQINEALCKVLAHNICVLVQATHELDIEPTFCS